jgi:(S)-2-hydroxy-acid oxidase
MISLSDFERYAIEHLPKKAKDFFAGGACGEFSQRNNEAAFQRLRLLPRVLRDVSHCTIDTSILGDKISMPICISPTAYQKIVHPDGEIAMARASKSMGTCMVVSTYATCSIEEVVTAVPNSLLWFQLYVVTDREFTRQLVLRAEAAGYKALVVTVDTHVVGIRYASIRNQFEVPPHLKVVNIESLNTTFNSIINEQAVTWKDIDWLKSQTKLPIVLKGILTVEDAREAVQHGIAGIWVSNHGGRQLDTVPATVRTQKYYNVY